MAVHRICVQGKYVGSTLILINSSARVWRCKDGHLHDGQVTFSGYHQCQAVEPRNFPRRFTAWKTAKCPMNSVVVTLSGVVPLANFNLTTGLSGITPAFLGGESDFRNTPPTFPPQKKTHVSMQQNQVYEALKHGKS